MENNDSLLRFASIKGRSVIARAESERIGEIEDVLFSAEDGRIGAILVNTDGIAGRLRGMLGQSGSAVRGEALEAVGRDAIICRDKYSLIDVERLDRRGLLSAQTLKGRRAFTDTGERLGEVIDVALNPDEMQVQAYVIATHREPVTAAQNVPAPASEEVLVPVNSEARVGPDLITVPARYVRGSSATPGRIEERVQPPEAEQQPGPRGPEMGPRDEERPQ